MTDAEGKALATLDELYAKLENKVIAAFNPTSEKAVDALAAYCEEKVIEDVAVASTDVELINYAYEQNYLIRGIVLFEEADYSEEGLLAIREKVNANHAKVAILPYEGISKEVVEYLQKLLVTVWVNGPEAESDTTFMTQILSGANGIVVSDRAAAEKCFTEYFEENSFTRQILIIGHRGLPSKAPENSIEGSKLAYEAGADIVENDVYISKDGVVIVMHDGTIDRTTNGTGYIESMTYEQLQQYTLNAVGGIEGAKIPTLEDYFKEFGSLDKHIFIELKSGNQNLLKPVVDLIRKYDMSSKVNFISFDTNQLARAQALAPEISVGYLCSGLTNTNEPLESVRSRHQRHAALRLHLQPKRVGDFRGIRDGAEPPRHHVLALDLQHAADAARAVLLGHQRLYDRLRLVGHRHGQVGEVPVRHRRHRRRSERAA